MDSSSPELQQFLNQEKQKAMVNEMIGKLTNVCWDKCITSTPGSKFRLIVSPIVLNATWIRLFSS